MAAVVLLAVSFAAIMVHGRASRAIQPQFVKIGETITAVDRPTRD